MLRLARFIVTHVASAVAVVWLLSRPAVRHDLAAALMAWHEARAEVLRWWDAR